MLLPLLIFLLPQSRVPSAFLTASGCRALRQKNRKRNRNKRNEKEREGGEIDKETGRETETSKKRKREKAGRMVPKMKGVFEIRYSISD